MRSVTLTAVTVAMTLSTAIVFAQKVNVDSDSAAPFGTYKTYGWVAGTPAPDQLNEQQLHAGVDARLAARGLKEVSADPDVVVSTHVTTKEEQSYIATGFGMGPWGFGGGLGPATVETYVEGTLIVDLYDAKTKKMVWRGVATATASDKPSKNAEKMYKALDKMFEKYPTAVLSSN